MKIHWNKLLNFLLLLLLMTVLAGFQNTFWYQLFGTMPTPMLWLCVIVYVAVYRKLYPALFTIYILGLALMGFTAMPIKVLLVTLLTVYFVLYTIRSRVFWDGPIYYTMMCAVAAASYHVIYFFLSWMIEKNSAALNLWDRLIQIILTPAFGVPLFWLLTRIDKATWDDSSMESGGLNL